MKSPGHDGDEKMKKLLLMGRSESGKTTLTQALNGTSIEYQKTQYVNYLDTVIDTPGEYLQTKGLGSALALYSYEADIVGLLIAATESYCLFPPNITCMANREVIGIVTKVDEERADPLRAKRWLELAGCKKIFFVSPKTNEGISEILAYLNDESQQKQQE